MRDVKRLARKATAAFLALVMILTYMPQFIMELRANPVNMTLSLTDALVAGGEITPRFVEGGAVEGQATVSWTTPPPGQLDRLVVPIRRWVPEVHIPPAAPIPGHYVEEIVVIHLLRTTDNEMWVEYRIFGETNQNLTGGFGPDITDLWDNLRVNRGIIGPDNVYNYLRHDDSIWITHMNAIEPNPVPPAVFNANRIASVMRPLTITANPADPSFIDNRPYGGPRHLVNDPANVPPLPPIDMGGPQQPFFRIERGGGFSFSLQHGTVVDQSAAHAVHFAWDDEVDITGNTFIVTMGGLEVGAFYDFVLSRSEPFDTIDPPAIMVSPLPLRLTYVPMPTSIASQRAFTGFLTSTVPLAQHTDREPFPDPPQLPQNRPHTVGRQHFDFLFSHPSPDYPPGPPSSWTPREDFLRGFTNWELPGQVRPPEFSIFDPLWHPWNLLDHTHPIHSGLNDFLPGFASSRAIDQPGFQPPPDRPNNMVRLRIEVPWRFHPGAPAVPAPPAPAIPQGWTRVNPGLFADMPNAFENITFNFNIDLQTPPNMHDVGFNMQNIFGTPVRTDPGTAPFIAHNRTVPRVITQGVGGPAIATEIYILGLEPSRLFQHFSFSPESMAMMIPGMANVVAGGGLFRVDNVHTFLEYDIVFIGGRFHVRIFPFVNAHGDYTVITESPPRANISAPHRSNGRDEIFIPLEFSTSSRIQVRFQSIVPGMDPIYSQVMVFTPVTDRHVFTEPANFVLHHERPPLIFAPPSNRDRAVFSVDVGWDLATVNQMVDYFAEVNPGRGPANSFPPGAGAGWEPPRGAIHIHPDNPNYADFIADGGTSGNWFLPQDELIFTYILRSRLNPWDQEGLPFAFVDLTVRLVRDSNGVPTHFEWGYEITSYPDPDTVVLVPTPTVVEDPEPRYVFVHVANYPVTDTSVQYDAIVLDQFGLPYANQNVTWAVVPGSPGSISSGGLLTGLVAADWLSDITAEATFSGPNGNITGQLTIPPHAAIAATDVNLSQTVDVIFQGDTHIFAAAVIPGGARQNVWWSVTDAGGNHVPGATITQDGILFVGDDVPANTILVVRATTAPYGSFIGAGDVFASHSVRVAHSLRRINIFPSPDVRNERMIRIGVGGENGFGPGHGISLNMIASRHGAQGLLLPHFFQFPDIYHVTAQLFDINANENRDEPITPPLPESNSQPMTLDAPAELDFPPPQNLRATVDPADEDNVDILGGYFDLRFDVALERIREYIRNSPRQNVNTNVTLRVFMGESQGDIQAIAGLAGSARAAAATPITVAATANGVPQTLAPFSAGGNLAHLRAGVVMFQLPLSPEILNSDDVTLSQLLKLHGLDRNRQYFVTMDAFIVFDTTPAYRDYSTTTSIAGVTTMGDLAPPDPGGMRPAAPRDLRVDDYTVASADLSWLPVAPLMPDPEDGQIRYQILRMRADQLPEELLDNRDNTMAQVIAAITGLGLSSPEAMLITQGANEVRYYSPGAGNPIGGIASGFTLSHGILDGDTEERVIFTDNNLSPNTLYFYYVRTVWHTPGGMTYSAWVGASVTTSLVEPPENLRIEMAPWIGGALWQDFDPRFQFVIRFDAPVGTLEGHGTEYDFQYSIRSGEDATWAAHEWLTPAMQLERIPIPGREGFYQFTYLISGLAPGTQYSIRVRTADLINGDYSMYSNIATTRTDTDQDAIDRDRDLQNLHQYLRDLIAQFIRQHHWTAQNSNNVFSAVYRPSMINNLLETNGSMIRLAMTGQDINVYYLPQALFLRTWQSEQGFIIAKGDMEIAIPSHAFNMIDNEAILQAQQRIRDVPGVLDYYVRITAVIQDHEDNIQIHGRQPAGSEIVLGFEVVEAGTTAAQLDEDILNVLRHRLDIDYYTAPFINEINQMLDREESYEDMVRRMHQIADIITNQMAAYVNSQLLPTLNRVYEVNYVSQPVTVRLINQPGSAIVNGFRFAGTNWVQQEVNIQGTARSMRTSGPGAFAFNIQNLNLPGVSQMQGNETLTALFVRYGLHDFLGTDATFNLQNNITLSQVQGIAARLAGAPPATNPQNWLRGQGYIVPVRGANSNATTQEAIYTLMAMYEIRSNTNVASLRISNFNAASGISGIDTRFRPAIQAAFELNIYTNAEMNPTAPITIEDVLRMILAINQRVPL
jgi:hypothetical protein